MAGWWEKYKKDRNLGGNKNSSSEKTGLKKEVRVTDENRQTAKSSTWWEDYKKTRDLDSKVAANRQRAERSQRFASANRQLDENRSRDAAEDEIRELFRNPFSSDAEWQAGVLQRNAERYKRDLPLYQEAMQNSSTWGEYFSTHRQAGESQSAVKHQFERYQQATQKAEQDRDESNLVNRPALYASEHMTPEQISAELDRLRSGAATPTVTDKDRNDPVYAYMYPDAVLRKDPHGARFDERLVEDAGQDAIDALYRPILTEQEKAAVEEADRKIIEDKANRNYERVQILKAAQSMQTERTSRETGNQLMEEIATGGAAAKQVETGRAAFEAKQQQIASETSFEIGDDLDSNRGKYNKMQKERRERGYILGYDWDNVPEARKQAVYALYTEDPEKAIELAKFYISDVRQAEDEERQAWYAQSGWTAALGLVSSAAAHLGAAVDPFGDVGQELTRRGDNALAGGSQWADAATGYQKIPEWVPIVGGKGAGDFYQTVGSVVQSAAVAAPAILVGRYDKAAAEVVGKLGLALMGSSAAASDYRESVAAGMDEDRAKLHALAAGVEEALFEEVSLDKLIKMDTGGGLKSALKNWLVQSGIEGSEELATSIANRITDEMISGAGQSKVERRASELIANGMSATQAKQQAESEWMKDTLYEGFSGFLSGGMMTGGDYALQGAANLTERAVNAAETRKVQKQAGAAVSRSEGSVEALQAYAKDKGIEIKAVETAEQSAEHGGQKADQNSYSARDYRSISDTNSKVVQSIRSDLRGKTVQEQQAVRDSLVEKYGEGIAPVVNQAISVETAARVRQEYGSVDSIQAARNQAVSEIKDESLRRAVSDGYDSAAYSLAASQGGEGGMNTMSRYIQQRNNTGTGEMSMNATVTAQDGSTKTIAITGMSEDGKRVSLADGSEVAVKDLQADADTTSAIQQLADLDLGDDATKVLQAYQQSGISGTEGYRWLMDYATAYNQGRTRQISLEQAAQRSSLDERTVMDAYTLGQQAANRETQAGLEKLKNLPKRKGASGRTANIETTEIKGKTMSKSELEQFEIANQYAQALGVDMKWFSSKEKDGKFVGKNGAYENGKIYMDIHAGRNFAADLTSGILATMGHELSHFEQQYAPEEYQALKEFLFEQIVKSSPNGEARLERLIWEKQKRSGYTLSRKAAEDEVVADACQKMLRDSKAVHDFASQQPEAANGVVRWLDKWFKRVRSIFGRGGNYSEEAQLMDSLEQDVKAAFGELWDKALKQAAKVHDEVGNIEKAAEESNVQNSDRDAEYLELAQDPEKNAARLQEMVDEAAELAGYTIKAYHGTETENRFTVFDEKLRGKNHGQKIYDESEEEQRFKALSEKAFYFAIDKEYAEQYGDNVMSVFLREGEQADISYREISEMNSEEIRQLLNEWKSDGIDSFYIHDYDYGNDEIGVFYSDQIKSADPVTYDDSGNVIPLSERFNAKNEDIRFSDRPNTDSTGRELSEGQQEYFKDSKILDKYGNLLTLYHGTASDFTVFDLGRSGKNYDGWSEYGIGIYLTPDKKFATYFSESASQRGGTPKLMELYVNIKNPFNANDPVTVDVSEYAKKYKLTEDDVKFLKKSGDRWLAFMREHNEDIYDFLTSHGYDGLWDAYGTHAPTQIVAFTENQVKNVDNLNPTDNPDIRYSDRDTEYLELAKDPEKNAARLQEMVDYAARKAGYTNRAYHGTAAEFTAFSKEKIGSAFFKDKDGFFFTTDQNGAKYYASASAWSARNGKAKVMDVVLKTKNPLIVESRIVSPVKYFDTHTEALIQKAKKGKRGVPYDSIIVTNDATSEYKFGNPDTERLYVVFEPEQIKSADPVTYDDQGNVIPLSERFNKANEDIRYSERDNAKPRSAQAQRDAGYKLSESKFYSLYSAHKLNMIGKGNVQEQISSIMADGFKGDGGFGNNVMPTNISYDVDENGKRIPRGLSAQKYAPKKGEYILLVPKEGVEVKGGRYNFTERVKPGYKPAFDYEIVQADYDGQPYYEMYEKAYDKSQAEKADVTLDGAQFSERDYSTPSDEELLMNARVEDAANVEQGRELKDYQALGKRIATLEKQLAEARRQTQLTNRALNTRGIGNVVKTVMKDYDITDARHNNTAKNATLALTDGYQKALDLLDKGASPADVNDAVYNGAVKAAEIILEQGTYSQNLGGKWQVYSASRYLGDNSQELIDSFVSEAYADFVSNRYREARPETAADRLVARTKKEAQERVDKYKGRSDALAEANRRLEEKTTQAETEAKEARKAAGELFLEIKDLRQELMDNKTMSEQERKAASKKLKSLNKSLEAKREEAASWQKRAKRNASLLKSALESKNRDISALEKKIQKYRDILAGKLRSPELTKLLEAERKWTEARVKEHKEQVFQNYKERKKASDLRGRIKNLSDEMKRRMTNPTDRAYVPASLYQSMTKLADVLDNVLSPNPGTKAEARYRAMMDAIRGMAREYEDVKNLDPVFASEYEQEVSDAIGEIERILERKNASWIDGLTGDTQKSFAELNSDELQQLYDLMQQINYTITNATKVFGNLRYESVREAIASGLEQQSKITPIDDVSKMERKKRLSVMDKRSPMRAVEFMSNMDRSAALYEAFQQVEAGDEQRLAWLLAYQNDFRELKSGKNEKAYWQSLTKQIDYGATDKKTGKPVTMTKMQAIQLFMTAQREAGSKDLEHLFKGGTTIRNAKDIMEGKEHIRSNEVFVTPELLKNIENSFTEWDRQYMARMRDYLKREGKAVNKVFYKLKHRVLPLEENYVPTIVDQKYLDAKLETTDFSGIFVKSPRSTHAITKGAPQPLIIDGMETMMNKHVQEQAQYIGMATAIRDFAKIFNGKVSTSENGVGYTSLKAEIKRNFGEKGVHLITQALIDIQGGSTQSGWRSGLEKVIKKLQTSFVRHALLFNLSVTIKQAASYVAAGSIISREALLKGNRSILNKNEDSHSASLITQIFLNPNGKTAQKIFARADKYTALHADRRNGMNFAEVELGQKNYGKLRQKAAEIGANLEQKRGGHKVREIGAALNPASWIQRMDVATTAALFVACEYQARMDGLEGEAYHAKVKELYERVLRETQPMYDSLHRTAQQKSGGSLAQYLFPFRTVPIQNHGQMASAYDRLLAAKTKSDTEKAEAAKFFRKTLISQIESAVVFSAMTFAAALTKRKTKKYRDEDGELTLESVARGFGLDVASTLVSVASPMWGSELWSLSDRFINKFTGKGGYTYDSFSVGALDMINDTAAAIDRIAADVGKAMRREDVSPKEFGTHMFSLLTKLGNLSGIPADTIKTYTEGFIGNIQDAIDGRIPALNDESWERDAATNARRYMKAIQAGDTEKAKAVMEEMRENYKEEKPGLSEKAITRKVRNALASYIKDQYTSKQISEEDAISYLVDYTGKKENDAFWQIREWEAKKAHKGDAEYTFSPYEHLRELIDNGKDLTGEIAYLQEHGKTASAINSDIKKYIRQQFDGGELTEQEAMEMLQKYHKVKDDRTGEYRNDTEDEAWFILDEWKAGIESEDDEEFSYEKYRKLYSAMDNDDDASAAWEEMSEHGVSDDTLKKAVSAHLQKQFQAGEISEDVAIDRLQSYRGMDEDEAYWQVDKWKSSDAAYKAGEDFNESNYRDLYAAIDGNKDPAAAMKELTSHGYKESDVYTQAKKYLSEKLEKGEITEQAFKNKLSRYCKIVKADEVDDAVQSVKNSVRYKKLMESKPNLDATESQVNAWYDGTANTRNNGHESAKTAGMSIENYIKAKTILADVKDANGNRTGEDEYIVALTKITWLTPRQKDALYYERYKGTTKYSHKTW